MRRTLVMCLFLLGCASGKPERQLAKSDVPYSSPGQPKPKGAMHCHMEQETGSNRMERVCTYEKDKAQAEDKTLDDAMIKMEQRAAQHVSPGQAGPGQ